MRILYITAELPYSTQEAFVIPEITELLRRGHELLIVPRSPRKAVTHADAGPLIEHTVRQPLVSATILLAAAGEFVRAPGRVLHALLPLRHTRSRSILMRNLSMVPKALWLAGIARRWRADHIHAHWAATPSTLALIASAITDIPWSFTAHRWDVVENNLLARKTEQATLARFISRSGLNLAANGGVAQDNPKARILHMGIELPAACPDQPLRNPPLTAICAANLLPVKGHKYLIAACALLRERGVEMSLWIAGQGELRERLEQQVAELGLQDRVRFLGQVSHADLLGFYARGEVDMVVLPSVDLGNGEHEGIPVSLIEPMGYGIPVISTLTGGIPELLEGGAGLLVPPQNAEALADALECLAHHPERRRQLASTGRQRVEEQYRIETVVTELEAHFSAQRS